MLAHKANESSFAQQNAGTEIRDSNKALRSGRFVFAVVVFTRQIRKRSNSLCAFTVRRCFPNAQTFTMCKLGCTRFVRKQAFTRSFARAFTLCNLGCTRHNANKFAFCSRLHELSCSFSSFVANNNSRSYSAVFRRLLLLWFFIARVIRRQRRNPAPLKIE